MPAPNHLNFEQKRTLQKALKEEENAYIRERILILLLLNDGKTQVQISELMGVHCEQYLIGAFLGRLTI
jgi:hypothetical protein